MGAGGGGPLQGLWVYGASAGEALDELDLFLLGLIDEQYTRRPFYGSRRMVVSLRAQGQTVNRKRVQRLMRVLGLAGMAPLPAARRGGHTPQPSLEY